MERFHFNIEDGQSYLDEEGKELPTLSAARHHSLRVISETLLAAPREFWSHRCFRVTVTDGDGLALFTLTVSAEDAPVLAGRAAQ